MDSMVLAPKKMETQRKTAFEAFRQICGPLAEHPTKENLCQLENIVKALSPTLSKEVFQELHEYVIFPLRLTLKRTGQSENVYISCLNTLGNVADKVTIHSWPFIQDFFPQVFAQINSSELGAKAISEEYKLALVSCLKKVLENSSTTIYKSIYSSDFAMPLGFGIHTLLKLATNESLRQLKIGAMKIISLLITANGEDDLKRDAGARFNQYFPGIILGLTKILNTDEKGLHTILIAALDTWSQLVECVMGDYNNPGPIDQGILLKLNILAQKVAQLVSFPHWKVREALVNGANIIVNSCSQSLNEIIFTFVNPLFALTFDEHSKIASASKNYLSNFLCVNLKNNKQKLCVEFSKLAQDLSSDLRTLNDSTLIVKLNTISGYLLLLENHLEYIKFQDLEMLLRNLVILAELDIRMVSLWETYPTASDPKQPLNIKRLQWQQKTFKIFHSDQVQLALNRVCNLVGKYGPREQIFSFLKSYDKHYTHQTYLIMNECIATYTQEDPEQDTTLSLLLELYMEHNLFKATSSRAIEPVSHKNDNPQKLALDILEKIIVLEGLAKIAQAFGAAFSQHLTYSLLPIVEQVGSLNNQVSATAEIVLSYIALACNYTNLNELILENMDYVLNSISLRLRTNPHQAVLILKAVLQLSSENILYLLDDLIEDILVGLDTNYKNSDLCTSHFRVLLLVLQNIKTWFPFSPEAKESSAPKDKQRNLKDIVLEFHAKKKEAEQLVDNFEEEDIPTPELPTPLPNDATAEEDETKPTPLELHVTLIEKILERCSLIENEKEVVLTLLQMDIMAEGLEGLGKHTDQLLPMVHKLWQPLKNFFTSPNLIIFMKATETLIKIARLSGNFIQKRTLSDVWPKIAQFLIKQSKQSLGKAKSSLYCNSIGFKLQLAVMKDLGDLSSILELDEDTVYKFCHVCYPYLMPQQPSSLQEAALNSILALHNYEPEVVKLFLQVKKLKGGNQTLKDTGNPNLNYLFQSIL